VRSRRNLLASIGAAGTIATAGCSGGSREEAVGQDDGTATGDPPNQDDGTATGDPPNQDDGTATGDPTSQDDESERSDDSFRTNGPPSPEAAVRQFMNALVGGDYEAANEVLHPASVGYPIDETDISVTHMTLDSVDEVTYDEASERVPLAPEEEFEQAVRDKVGTNNWTLVYAALSEADTVFPAVETNDGWVVLRTR